MGRQIPAMSGGLKITTMAIGAALLLAALIAAFIRETMSPPQVAVVHTVSALAGGLVAVGIAGYISVSGTVAGLALKAGGPLAVTVVLFIVDPSSIAASAGAPAEKKEASNAVDTLSDELRGQEVTIVENGRETKVSGAEAVRRLAQAETGLKPGQLPRSASTSQLLRIRDSLRTAKTGGKIVIPTRPPPR